MSGHGFVVVRHGMPVSVEFAPGQGVEQYELLAPLPPRAAPRPHGERVPWDAHGEAKRRAEEVMPAIKRREWRTVDRHSCPCGQSIVTEAVDPRGVRWAVITRPEHIPPAFRRLAEPAAPMAWPLHREPNGMPHVDTARCRACLQVFVVALTEASATLIPVRPVYGARVAP